MSQDFISEGLKDAHTLLHTVLEDSAFLDQIREGIEILSTSLEGKAKILSCGNGGSLCDALHFAEELTGRFRKDRRPLGAIALGDPAHFTCVANDFGADDIFSRSVEALGRPGDSLLAISTSGNSPNILKATKAAHQAGMKVIALTGKGGGELKNLADLSLIVPTNTTERIQEIHIKIIHFFIEGIERRIFPELY